MLINTKLFKRLSSFLPYYISEVRKMGKKAIIAALAALAAAGCSSKDSETEYIYINQQQTPIAALKAISSDGDFAALNMQEKNDLEAMVFSAGSGSLANVSNDPANSDFAQAFAGHHLVTTTRDGNGEEDVKIYDAVTGQRTFQSEKFDWIDRVLAYPDGSKVLFAGIDDSNYMQVYTHTIGSQSAEKMFPTATASHVQAASQDNSIIFLYTYSQSIGNVLHMLKTSDNSVTPLINLCCHDVMDISANNKTAVLFYWSTDQIKIVDIDTAGVQAVNMPANKEFDGMEHLSENGHGAIIELEDATTKEEEYWHLNTQTGTLELITQREVGSAYRYPRAISPDATIIALSEYDAPGDHVLIYNTCTKELYNPLLGTASDWMNFRGFGPNGKAILQYEDDITFDEIVVLHDPATKTNTTLGDAANYRINWAQTPTADGNYLPINAMELATGWQVVLLEDLANSGRKVIKQPGYNLELITTSPDSKHVLVSGRDSTSTNLFVYNIANDTLEKVTNNTDPRLDWINVAMHSKDSSNAYFEERFDNGTRLLKELDYETKEVKEVSYR